MKRTAPSYVTKRAIKIARFMVMEDDSGLRGHNVVRQATAATLPLVGISAQHPSNPELPVMKQQYELGFEDGRVAGGGGAASPDYTPYAAVGTSEESESIPHFDENESCGLVLGDSVNAGDFLTADSDGAGVTASAGEYYGARALQDGIAGEQIDVTVIFGQLNP